MAKRIIRHREAQERLGVGHSKYYADFIGKGLLRPVSLGPKSGGILEHELDALIDALASERDRAPGKAA